MKAPKPGTRIVAVRKGPSALGAYLSSLKLTCHPAKRGLSVFGKSGSSESIFLMKTYCSGPG